MVARIGHLAGDCGYFSTEEGVRLVGFPPACPQGTVMSPGGPRLHSHQILRVQGRF